MILVLVCFTVLAQAIHQTAHTVSNCVSSKHVGSVQNGNYVWAGAMNIAWSQLVDEIVKAPIQLQIADQTAQSIVTSLNCPVLVKSDLAEPSYYAKAGYGPNTVTEIKEAMKAKFPDSTLPELDAKIGKTSIIAYAYIFKKVKYPKKFEKLPDFDFSGKPVPGFLASNRDQKKQVSLHTYSNDENFLLELKTDDPNAQLFLYKTEQNLSVDTVAKKISNTNENGIRISSYDQFKAPVVKLSVERRYEELINKSLKNDNFTDYQIAEMKERVKFDMDEEGVRVENDASITLMTTASAPPANPPKPKLLYLNKPFWVILREKGKSPFFIARIVNPQ